MKFLNKEIACSENVLNLILGNAIVQARSLDMFKEIRVNAQ